MFGTALYIYSVLVILFGAHTTMQLRRQAIRPSNQSTTITPATPPHLPGPNSTDSLILGLWY